LERPQICSFEVTGLSSIAALQRTIVPAAQGLILRRALASDVHVAQPGKRQTMRSNLVYSAGLKIENRFLLATVVMRAVRKLHIDSTRTEDTANHVFSQVAEGKFISVQMPAVVAAPAIDALLIASAA
jgi:hypothetical protein